MPIIDSDASNYVNDPNIEYQWAIKAHQHAEIYFNLLCSLESQFLKLTKIDDEIYREFRQVFTNFDVGLINEDEFKSSVSKELWRPFCESFKNRVEDYNMATLLRIDPTKDYNEENTTLVPRIQFYSIEIARNREGKNVKVREQFKKIDQFVEK